MNYTYTQEPPLEAILGRIALEYSGAIDNEDLDYDMFVERFSDFTSVRSWVKRNKIILLVDELNAIPAEKPGYRSMSFFLNNLVGRLGSALVYSTHLRDTKDLLRGRQTADQPHLSLSTCDHDWLPIPRIINENCLLGLLKGSASQPSFWSAVLRGRLPALLVQYQDDIERYGIEIFPEGTTDQQRMKALASVISGNIGNLPYTRGCFRAYSYMSERFSQRKQQLFAWPPFLVAQEAVLGKNYAPLRNILEAPDIEEAKAFKALTQLAVLVRLLSNQPHELVPHLPTIPPTDSFAATEMYYVSQKAKTIDSVIEEVQKNFSETHHVQQVVAVPFFASFPTYDFFVLHRVNKSRWGFAAGYQCKQGTERPSEDASPKIPLSVWIEGKCRKYRVENDGTRVPRQLFRGWTLLGESSQESMLGVTVSEALPSRALGDHVQDDCCPAAMRYNSGQSPDSKSCSDSNGSPALKCR